MEGKLTAALDLMRRLPPHKTEDNLADLIALVPDLQDDLLSTVDQPLQVSRDSSGRKFLLCDYNRDGDESYRSPWTNEYVPPLVDGIRPGPELRALEELANEVFDTYRDRYYDGGVSSAYLWDLEATRDFAACVLFQKESADVDEKRRGRGRWDAVHVFETKSMSGGATLYKLTSTVMVSVNTGSEGTFEIAGNLTRQSEHEAKAPDAAAHVMHMGRQLEEMEHKLRETLLQVYFGKTLEVCSNLRMFQGAQVEYERREVQANLAAALNDNARARSKAC